MVVGGQPGRHPPLGLSPNSPKRTSILRPYCRVPFTLQPLLLMGSRGDDPAASAALPSGDSACPPDPCTTLGHGDCGSFQIRQIDRRNSVL